LCRVSKVGPNVNPVARLPAGNVASGRAEPLSSHSFALKSARQSFEDRPFPGRAWKPAEENFTNPQGIPVAYLKSFDRYVAQLDEICQRSKIERVQVDTRRPLAGVILDHRNQRAMLRASR
jgi:hypothetical protein